MDKQRKLKKLAKLQAIMEKGNPEIARFLFALEDNIDNVSSEINTLIQSLAEQNFQSINELRQDFEDIKPTDERLAEIIKPLIPEVVDGETPSKDELLAIIEPLIPKVENGKTPSKSDLLDIIKPLIPEIDEDEIVGRIVAIVESNIKLPSVEVIADKIEKKVELNLPKFGEPIRDSLELLKGKNRLDKDAIRGLENYDDIVDLAKKPKKTINKYYSGGSDNRAIWGNITGTLSDQTDLQDALNLKFDSADFNTDWDTRLATKSTTDLAEGTNLYFTNQRAIDAVDLTPYAINEDVKKYSGFENRTDSTIAMSGNNFEITTLTSYDVYFVEQGKQTIDSTFSVEITNDQDITYIYFDWDGTGVRINKSTSTWFLTDTSKLPVAIVFKDGATYALTDERHGYSRSLPWHSWAHQNIGTMYTNGLAGTFTGNTLSITQGVLYDEDIRIDTGGTQTTTSLWYRNATDGMRLIRGSSTPYRLDGVIKWDNGSGTLQDVGNNNYFVSWVYASNDPVEPIYTVIGQGNHANLNDARAEAQPIINLSTTEWKLLYKVIFRNTATTAFIESQDFRNVQTGVPTQQVSPTSHSILTDRDAINSHPISAITDLQSDLDARVPYTGANANVDLGANDLTVGNIDVNGEARANKFYAEASSSIITMLELNNTHFDFKTLMNGEKMVIRNGYTGGGWARGLLDFENTAGSRYFSLGAFGSGQGCTYGYIGNAYNDAVVKFSTTNTLDGVNRLGVNIPSNSRPQYTLDVNGDTNINGDVKISADNLKLYFGAGDDVYDTFTGSLWEFNQGANNVSFSGTGNVGIGTATPTEKLEIDGNLFLNGDNDKVLLGTGKDASISYNSTNMIINPKEVGTGYLGVEGDIFLGNNKLTVYGAGLSTRSLVFSNESTSALISSEFRPDNWIMKNSRTSGGFARNIMQFVNIDDVANLQIGAYGTGQDINYMYIGAAYNNPLLTMRTVNTTGAVNYLGVALSGLTSPSETLQVNGNTWLNTDNQKILLGTGKDASISYNGTDLQINPREVGSGVIDIRQATGTAPVDAVNVSAWVDIKINGTAYKMPLYQ